MIFNMHIRRDYRMLGMDDPKKRTPTLCGKLTARKYTGVPFITPDQPAWLSDDTQDVGWCLDCCRELILDVIKRTENRVLNPKLLDLYGELMKVAGYQMHLAAKVTSNN